MGLDEKIIYLIIGGIIGFVLGRLSVRLRSIEKKVIEVDEIVKNDHKDRGFLRLPVEWEKLALVFVVLMSFYAAFMSQQSSNDVETTQKDITGVVSCIQGSISQTLVAVNERTTYSGSQTKANIELQQAQADFVQDSLRDPPLESTRVTSALRLYFEKLQRFVTLQMKTMDKQAQNPYPTDEELQACIDGEMRPK